MTATTQNLVSADDQTSTFLNTTPERNLQDNMKFGLKTSSIQYLASSESRESCLEMDLMNNFDNSINIIKAESVYSAQSHNHSSNKSLNNSINQLKENSMCSEDTEQNRSGLALTEISNLSNESSIKNQNRTSKIDENRNIIIKGYDNNPVKLKTFEPVRKAKKNNFSISKDSNKIIAKSKSKADSSSSKNDSFHVTEEKDDNVSINFNNNTVNFEKSEANDDSILKNEPVPIPLVSIIPTGFFLDTIDENSKTTNQNDQSSQADKSSNLSKEMTQYPSKYPQEHYHNSNLTQDYSEEADPSIDSIDKRTQEILGFKLQRLNIVVNEKEPVRGFEKIAEASREYSNENSRRVSQSSIRAGINKEENDIIQDVIEEQDIEQENYITPRPFTQIEEIQTIMQKMDAETPYFDILAKNKLNVGNRVNNADVKNFSMEKTNKANKSPNPFSSNKHNYSISSASSKKFTNSKSKSPIRKLPIERALSKDNLKKELFKPVIPITKYSNNDTKKKQPSVQNLKNKTSKSQGRFNLTTLNNNLIDVNNFNPSEKIKNTAPIFQKNKQATISKPIPKSIENTSLITNKQVVSKNKTSKANNTHNQSKGFNAESVLFDDKPSYISGKSSSGLKKSAKVSAFIQFLQNSGILESLDNLNEGQCIQELDDAFAKISIKCFLVY